MLPERPKFIYKLKEKSKILQTNTIKNQNSFQSSLSNANFDSPVKNYIYPENRKAFTQVKLQKSSFESPLGVKNLNNLTSNSALKNNENNKKINSWGFKKHKNQDTKYNVSLKNQNLYESTSNFSASQRVNKLSFSSKRSAIDDEKQRVFNQKIIEYNRLLKKLEDHSNIISQLKKLKSQKYKNRSKEFQISKQNCESSIDFFTQRVQKQKQLKKKKSMNFPQKSFYSPKLQKNLIISDKQQRPLENYRLFRSVSMNKELKINMINSFIQQSPIQKTLLKEFIMGKKLGQGAFGVVTLVKHIKTNAIFCLKIINKTKIKKANLIHQLNLEIKIHKDLKHKNIVSLYGIFDDLENIYLVLEYLQGCSLFSYLKKQKKIQQNIVKDKILQISQGLKYLHNRNIVHRDIKPENILLTNQTCKICDFGWASYCDQRRKTTCGTLDYSAPEIVNGTQYDLSVDMWCLGILTYELLYGKPPFYDFSRKKTLQKIMDINEHKAKIQFPNQINVSSMAKDFIMRLLIPEGNLRMTIQEALSHKFLSQTNQKSS